MFGLLWSFAGDGKLKVREDLGNFISRITTIPLPPSSSSPIIDFEVSLGCSSVPVCSKLDQY